MNDDKHPKADMLRKMREEAFEAEQVRQKAAAEQEQQKARMSIRPRNKTQQDECKAAEARIAAKRKSPRVTQKEDER